VFAVILLAAPLFLVLGRGQPWQSVAGLFVSGCGFLLLAIGVFTGGEGANRIVIGGVMVAFFGQMLQKQMTNAMRKEMNDKSGGSE